MTTDTTARDAFLDELQSVLELEHALVVEFLLVHAALGHNLGAPDNSPEASSVAAAASHAFETSSGEMGHLRRVADGLAAAGRTPRLRRASQVALPSGAVALGNPPTTADVGGLAERHTAIASAVDKRYEALRATLDSPTPPFEGELLETLRFAIGFGLEHASAAATLAEHLDGLDAAVVLRIPPRPPNDDTERRLLDVADASYGLVVALLRAWLGHGADLRGQAVDAMTDLNAFNLTLAELKLLPRFLPPD